MVSDNRIIKCVSVNLASGSSTEESARGTSSTIGTPSCHCATFASSNHKGDSTTKEQDSDKVNLENLVK